MKQKNTPENRAQLAREIVDSWDLDDLREYGIDRLMEYLNQQTDEQFDISWKDYYDG